MAYWAHAVQAIAEAAELQGDGGGGGSGSGGGGGAKGCDVIGQSFGTIVMSFVDQHHPQLMRRRHEM